MAPIHEGFHEKALLLGGDFGHGNDFGGVHSGGLFAQHRFAGAQGGNRQFGVPRMRGRDVDRVDVRISQQRCMVSIAFGSGDFVGVSKDIAAGRIAAGNGGQLA